ncbi:SAM4 [Candida pseudojiufengensis]|uniref:SAM4 n=1 Tax=Candida pseudojiufengensis TaxID=497109 RepID=UPI002225852B|nr:SAM4 [Candida pseudojiufengensis]KAI5964608.1 SAM4 [Candida pseudojiufengensis]
MTTVSNKKIIIDGALGTELENLIDSKVSYLPSKSPLWSGQVLIDAPHFVEKVHQSYIESGSNLIITSTYQLSYKSLQKHTKFNDDEIKNLWQKSIDVIYEAISKASSTNKFNKIQVAGSIGPYAAFSANGSEYTGDYGSINILELQEFHKPLVEFFSINKGIDFLLFETIPNFLELKAVNEYMKESKIKDYVLSITCQSKDKLTDGTPLEEVKNYLDSNYDSKLLSINCVDYTLINNIISQFPGYKFYIYPNLGFEYDSNLHQFKPKDYTGENTWKKFIENLNKDERILGIGGCCNTGPKEIKQIYDIVNS